MIYVLNPSYIAIAILGLFFYRWNKALLSTINTMPLNMRRLSEGNLPRGLSLAHKAVSALEPSWYVWTFMFGVLFAVYSLLYLPFGSSRPPLLLFHHWALGTSAALSIGLVMLSGSFLLVSRVNNPYALLSLSAFLTILARILIQFFTPVQIFDYSYRHSWLAASGSENFWIVPLYPMTYPVYGLVLLTLSLCWVGSEMKRILQVKQG